MARSSDINQRIVLTGADEVRRHLEEIAKAGERSGNQTRAALQAATGSLNTFTSSARTGAASSGQMRFALQNLSFQVNDVATSLASGGDVMRVFAQQGGQVFQVFQQGGGFSAVMRAAGAAVASFITPTTAAVAALVALGAELAVVIARAASAEQSAKKFDVILKGVGDQSGVTGKQLEEATHQFHDVGLSASEAREQFQKFIQAGGRGSQTLQVTRIAAELETVLGKGSMDKFLSAAAEGGPALEEFAKKLNIIPKVAADTSKQLEAASASTQKFNDSVNDAIVGRNRALADEQRQRITAIADLTRKRGSAEEEIVFLSNRRIEDLNRQHTQTLNDLIAQRNKDNAVALAAYNKTIEDAAIAAGNKQSLIAQIGERVLGSFRAQLTPIQEAVLALSTAWDKLQETIAKSPVIQQIILDLAEMARSITAAIKWVDELAAALRKVPGLPPFLGGAPTVPGSAAGEYVRGPGTGTSDSILRRVSNGEFIVNAMATRMNLPLLQAINSMRMPAMPRFSMPRGFAMGGLATAGAGGARTPVILNIGGETFNLEGDAATAQRVIRFGRKRAMLSAGRLPSTA